ncbi:MAG: helix-turn-helix transcriptional regulator [Ignavibacteria bacterium]|nr:helix-turn-helix transcriptional regulator [Ignavibacteria bacterium]
MGSKIFEELLKNISDEKRRFIRISMDIADQIAQYLKEKKMTQKELAIKLGKNESEISKWLNGSHNFTLDTIAKIESALNEDIILVPKYAYENVYINYESSSSYRFNKDYFERKIANKNVRLEYFNKIPLKSEYDLLDLNKALNKTYHSEVA